MNNSTSTTPPSHRFEINVSLVHKVSEFYKLFHNYLKLFPKTERYLLGQKIDNSILEILELFLVANYSPKHKKIEAVKKASNKIDLLKHLIRLVYEIRTINLKKYLILQEKTLEIGKMTGGWLKSL